MKIIYIIVITSLLYCVNLYSAENDCSDINKLTKEYAKCIADIAKKKGSEIKDKAKEKSIDVKEKVATDKNKKRFSNFKKKLKKFGDSKTGADFLKKE